MQMLKTFTAVRDDLRNFYVPAWLNKASPGGVNLWRHIFMGRHNQQRRNCQQLKKSRISYETGFHTHCGVCGGSDFLP